MRSHKAPPGLIFSKDPLTSFFGFKLFIKIGKTEGDVFRLLEGS